MQPSRSSSTISRDGPISLHANGHWIKIIYVIDSTKIVSRSYSYEIIPHSILILPKKIERHYHSVVQDCDPRSTVQGPDLLAKDILSFRAIVLFCVMILLPS